MTPPKPTPRPRENGKFAPIPSSFTSSQVAKSGQIPTGQRTARGPSTEAAFRDYDAAKAIERLEAEMKKPYEGGKKKTQTKSKSTSKTTKKAKK